MAMMAMMAPVWTVSGAVLVSFEAHFVVPRGLLGPPWGRLPLAWRSLGPSSGSLGRMVGAWRPSWR
eukprot:3926681-Pyramimonas_sp.AAC.1